MRELTAHYVVSVVARDRVGIIADVSQALYDLGANLEAMSQTVVWDWFTMLICAAFPEGVTTSDIRTAVEGAGDFEAIVLPQGGPSPGSEVRGEPFMVTVMGEDRPGILRRWTRCFADKGINIEDVWNEVRENRIIVIFHVIVPPAVDRKELRYSLDTVAEELGVSMRLQHQDVFTATNSLSMHTKRT
ncbi:MAG: ACT domain-containing protein [bacterium]|nr:ACT domain-containing protein [bacterium]